MKKYFFLLILLIASNLHSQNAEYNLKNGYVAEGYDVVSYFQQQVTKGNKQFTASFDGVKFQFSSKENLVIFSLLFLCFLT